MAMFEKAEDEYNDLITKKSIIEASDYLQICLVVIQILLNKTVCNSFFKSFAE